MKLSPGLHIGPLLAAFLIRVIAAEESEYETASTRSPSSQRRDADAVKKGPNVLFIMSDDQGEILLHTHGQSANLHCVMRRFASEVDGLHA